MEFSLSEAQDTLQARIIEFAQANLNENLPHRYRQGIFERPLWELCGHQGIPGLVVAENYGGKGLDALSTVVALEGLGYGCEDGGLGFAITAHMMACVIPVSIHGSKTQKTKFLPGLSNGELIATNAITEQESGSDVFQMKSRAKPHNNGYVLSGQKSYCANAPVADICIAYALTDPDKGFLGGVSCFLLEKNQHKFAINSDIEKLGLRTCTTGQINLDGISVSEEDMIGKTGGGGMIFSQSMLWERICMSALHVGTMTRLLERCIGFAKNRKSGGVAISTYQAVSHKLVDLQVRLEASKLLVYHTAWKLDQGHNVNRDASIVKLYVSEQFKSMTTDLMQIYASTGYTVDSEIGRCVNDALASTIYSGTSEIQKNIIAKWIGL